jgi:putative peptidoglycan lipid II flippase
MEPEQQAAPEDAPGGSAAKPAYAGLDETVASNGGESTQADLAAHKEGQGVRAGGLGGGTPTDAVLTASSGHRRLVASASFIMVGNLLSSLLGMVRLQVLNGLFGQGAETGAFFAALRIPQQFFDLLVGGAISGALIPTFVDYSAPEKRRELWRIFSTIITLVALLTGLVAGLLILFAPLYLPALIQFQDSSTYTLTLALTRLVLPSVLILGLFAVGAAMLYALRSVIFASWASGLYHVGIILGAAAGVIILGQHYGIYGAAAGVLLGALGEVTLIGIGLARQGARYRPALDLKHPAVRQIARLYGPVMLGLVISVIGQQIDLRLATSTGEANVGALASGNALVQFPVGLVAAALSFAILPTLTSHASDGNTNEFKRTLRLGIKLGLLLMIPAMVGLAVLRQPVVAVILRHGAFDAAAVDRTSLALLNYSYQLPFLVLDQLLIAAFYARKNTRTPVLIGIVGWLFYLAVALPLVGSIGMPALAFANTFQNSMHALILLVLLRRAIGPLAGEGLLGALGKICLAAGIMGALCWALLQLVSPLPLFSLAHFTGQLLTVAITAGAGTLAYLVLIRLFGLEEMRLLGNIIRRRLAR